MKDSEKDRLASAAVENWCAFEEALSGTKRAYPLQQFLSFVDAAKCYIQATRHDQLVRRDVAKTINGLTEQLRLERRRVPGRVLYEADRLECMLFEGFDPHFQGDEPPGL